MKVARTFLLLVLMFITSGCGASLFELSSVEDNANYYQGREILKKEDKTAVIYLNFEEQAGPYFIFYVEAINKSSDPLLLDPANMSMEILETNKENFAEGKMLYALDPERQIDMLNEDMADLETGHAVSMGLHGLFAVAEIVSDIAEDDVDEAGWDAVKWGAAMNNERIEYEIESEEIMRDKEHWQNQVLRKTTLYTDDRFGGIIYVPFNEDARLVKVNVPFGNSYYEFLFNQKEIH